MEYIASNDNNEFRFYVYAWFRPSGEPFYIGKGNGNRLNSHRMRGPLFNRTVKKIERSGLSPSVRKIADGLSEKSAFDLERKLIKLYGRKDNGTGILANMTDGGDGQSGAVVGVETRKKLSVAGLGRSHSKGARSKISVARTGMKFSDEHKANMALSRIGIPLSPESIKKRTDTTIKSGPRGHNKSGLKGVKVSKVGFSARITINGNSIHIGTFPTPEAAGRAYDRAAYAAWGGECYLNFGVPEVESA